MFLLIYWLQVTTARTAVVEQLLLIAPASAWIRLAINANMCLSANHSTLGPWNQYGIKLKFRSSEPVTRGPRSADTKIHFHSKTTKLHLLLRHKYQSLLNISILYTNSGIKIHLSRFGQLKHTFPDSASASEPAGPDLRMDYTIAIKLYCGSNLYLPEIRHKCLKTLLNV
jgi:hypothetical protein